jgi:hypothetical protein
MKKSKLGKIVLLIAGVIGMGIGGAQLFMPVAFEASAGISLGENISLLSEIRAAGGALLVAGIIMLSGVFNSRLSPISIMLSSLFYLTYGLSRMLSMMMDGIPSESLIIAAITEIVIGLMSTFVLLQLRKQPHSVV